jgi:hypothetical protein
VPGCQVSCAAYSGLAISRVWQTGDQAVRYRATAGHSSEKGFQQLTIVRRVVADLFLPIRSSPSTVRESD